MTDITKFNRNGSIRDIGDSKVRNSIANEFSTTTSYSTNDLILHDGQLYKFNSNHEAGIWNSSEVIPTNILNNVYYKDSGQQTILGSVTTDNFFIGQIFYRQIGQLLYIWNTSYIKLKESLTTADNYRVLASLPDEYKKVASTRGIAAIKSQEIPTVVTYSNSGKIALYRGSFSEITTDNYIYISIMALLLP